MKVLVMQRIWLALIVILIAGCSSLGLQATQTNDQRLYSAYGTAASAEKLTTNLLNTHSISSAQAQDMQDSARFVKGSLDDYFAGTCASPPCKPMTAVDVLALINKSLIKLETFLINKGAKT